MTTMKHLRQTQDRLAELNTVVARIARDLVEGIRALVFARHKRDGADTRLVRQLADAQAQEGHLLRAA